LQLNRPFSEHRLLAGQVELAPVLKEQRFRTQGLGKVG
jgi:hypothetical protein